MDPVKSSYSPNILIYLEVEGKKVRLSDVLSDTATLYESAEFPPGTAASLVFSIDGIEERQDVVLPDGIAKDSHLVALSYESREAA